MSSDNINVKTVIKLMDDLKFFIIEKIKDSNEFTKTELDSINQKIKEMKIDINNMGQKINNIPNYSAELKISAVNNFANLILKILISVISAISIYYFTYNFINK